MSKLPIPYQSISDWWNFSPALSGDSLPDALLGSSSSNVPVPAGRPRLRVINGGGGDAPLKLERPAARRHLFLVPGKSDSDRGAVSHRLSRYPV
jgi:hypothetical protein